MPLILSHRAAGLQEYMDRSDCDFTKLENTYRYFGYINTLLSRWKQIYKEMIRPFALQNRTATVLDIGFGGGDIPLKLAYWSAKDKIDLKITAIDPDERAFNFAKKQVAPENVTFLNCAVGELTGKQFDFVISNHLVHHLDPKELTEILEQSKRLSKQAVIFNDIRRSDLGYLFFHGTWPLFRDSFITPDGLTSIKRSYTYKELKGTIPDDWRVRKLFPFRLLLMYEHT